MLRAGSEEHWFYRPGRLFSGLAPRSLGEGSRHGCTTLFGKWHGGWVSRPHGRVLEARALLVCHRRVWKISRSTIQGHRDGHAATHSPQSQATICRPLCPWMADRPPRGGVDLPKRTNTAATRGMDLCQSIAGVAPAGVSRRMFRCLWHTSQGSRLVL